MSNYQVTSAEDAWVLTERHKAAKDDAAFAEVVDLFNTTQAIASSHGEYSMKFINYMYDGILRSKLIAMLLKAGYWVSYETPADNEDSCITVSWEHVRA